MHNRATGMAVVVMVATLLVGDAFAATFGVTPSGSSAVFYVDTNAWADIHYVQNNQGQLNYRMGIVNGRNQYTVTGLSAGETIDYSFTYWDVSCDCARDTAWTRYTHSGTTPPPPPPDAGTDAGTPPPPTDAGTPPTGPIVPLYTTSTPLEPATVQETASAIITRVGDRVRDRHAREDMFQAYDHYLPLYFQARTHYIEIVDEVAKGGNRVTVNLHTVYPYERPDFRAFFRGLGTVAEYFHNAQFTQVNDYHFTSSVDFNAKEGRAIRVGDRMELEVGVFLRQPVEGRFNYYATTYLYMVGSGGVVPFDVTGSIRDSIPMPQAGWSGGRTTLSSPQSNEPDNRFLQMANNLAPVSAQPFVEGRRIHHTNFGDGSHSEPGNPALTQHQGKLGPNYVAPSCVACHVQNGRALPPGNNTTLTNYVVKVGQANGAADPFLGYRLQPRRTSGTPEGEARITGWTVSSGTYGDGTRFELRRPNYGFTNNTPTNYSARITPQLVGMGLLEAIPESAIAALADPNDSNGDGISGRMHQVRDPQTGVTRLGRFGWKASTATVRHQVAEALNSDIGVTTSVFPSLDCGPSQQGCTGTSTELANTELDKLTRYISLLGVPARRNLSDATALRGETLFNNAGCARCHTASLTTSAYHPHAELRGQTIRPYTDLLLHDMGTGLADNLPDGQATGAEWRTPPLWGIGLTAGVSGGEAYLHDGRARNLAEAILWHGGEGQAARNNFANMNSADRDALLAFLRSL
ncbi:di-heme oxidoredictase family protein [Myxococcus xanthus]|uniref:Thiol oxidoreductase n=1 Tax=Myxococcus xanthus TaxID=34 RepID=A0AAE6G0Q3_MYXXA|nr:di-heme oxidoredictase family protein [Myxococcus xanthus]QDE68771.1 thiol oxidoreductase [Myxococcus xanthus]QDE76047.1 thiol oxidoreductase [Myxococcus xanthus]QDE83472.1 thiol oxidoreductase [Myxococcus xanthus]QDE97595.1 thiol oxidoreductase [Myxococcus xanthus]QDF05252.1 thiol oxidoreductase [Myxococcus xanthus]